MSNLEASTLKKEPSDGRETRVGVSRLATVVTNMFGDGRYPFVTSTIMYLLTNEIVVPVYTGCRYRYIVGEENRVSVEGSPYRNELISPDSFLNPREIGNSPWFVAITCKGGKGRVLCVTSDRVYKLGDDREVTEVQGVVCDDFFVKESESGGYPDGGLSLTLFKGKTARDGRITGYTAEIAVELSSELTLSELVDEVSLAN